MSVLTRMYSLLQVNPLNWLIDLYSHSHTRHEHSDYCMYNVLMHSLLQANQLKLLIGL
jgi:hypothetical protein